jgi:hypothetical protein
VKDSGWSEADLVQQPDGSYSKTPSILPSSPSFPKKTKFRNVPVWRSDCKPIEEEPLRLHDHKVASIKECRRYHDLVLLEQQKQITELQWQVPFIVCNGAEWDSEDGTSPLLLTPVKYVADFTYFDTSLQRYVVEDTKGVRTRLYLLKRQLFLLRYPQYIFREL